MAKRAQPILVESIPTELLHSKTNFIKVLDERITLGEELYNEPVQNETALEKNKEGFSDWNDYNLEYLKQAFNKEYNEYRDSYDNAGSFLYPFGGGDSQADMIKEFKEKVNHKLTNLKKLKAKTDLLKTRSLQYDDSKAENILDRSQVFIVHGHDEEAKSKTARFVEKLGFKAIILHEQASSGKTIIEKIEEYSNVGFGIVLYSPCDVGGKQSANPDLKSRARQNVVFEHGFLIGKIGRSNVCALVKGDIETPNDISGVVYVTMDGADAWHFKIAKELKKSGYNVDMNNI